MGASSSPSNPNKHRPLTILQININELHRKTQELEQLSHSHKIDILAIQETKLEPHHKIPNINNYTPIRTDRQQKQGGGFLTYISHDINFTPIQTPGIINVQKTELQITKIHLTQHKTINLVNLYIPPRNTTDENHASGDEDITVALHHITSIKNSLIAADVNAHSKLRFSPIEDHRGDHISDIIQNSYHTTLNTNTPILVPTQ